MFLNNDKRQDTSFNRDRGSEPRDNSPPPYYLWAGIERRRHDAVDFLFFIFYFFNFFASPIDDL